MSIPFLSFQKSSRNNDAADNSDDDDDDEDDEEDQEVILDFQYIIMIMIVINFIYVSNVFSTIVLIEDTK